MEMKKIFNTTKGFTLLEILVSIGVLALMSTLLTQVFITSTRSNTKTEIAKDVKQNGDFATEVIARLIRNSLAITTLCSTTGTTTSSIAITNPDGGATTLGCALDGTVTRIASTSAGATAYLTASNLTLGGTSCSGATLTFTCTAPVDQPTTVSIAFTLSQKGTPEDQSARASASFQTTVAIRNKD